MTSAAALPLPAGRGAHGRRRRSRQRAGHVLVVELGDGTTLDVTSVATIVGNERADRVDTVLDLYAELRHATERRLEATSTSALTARRAGARS